MNRDKAIAAALDALDGSDDIPWAGMGAALNAALPHLVGDLDRGILQSLLGTLRADRRRLIDYASIACSDDPPRALVLHARAEGIRLAMERIDGLLYLIPVDGP